MDEIEATDSLLVAVALAGADLEVTREPGDQVRVRWSMMIPGGLGGMESVPSGSGVVESIGEDRTATVRFGPPMEATT